MTMLAHPMQAQTPTGQFKIRNDAAIQIGYSNYKYLTFGASTSTPNNGNFALEYCSTCTPKGFNIWKPWPTSNYNNYLLFIQDNGQVGIGGQGDFAFKLTVNGTLKANGMDITSDQRLKENIVSLSGVLDTLMLLKPYHYYYKQTPASRPSAGDSLSVNVNKDPVAGYNFDQKLHFGLVAQDLQKVYPNLVTQGQDGMLSINYVEIIPLLIQSIQEQQAQIVALEETVAKLKK